MIQYKDLFDRTIYKGDYIVVARHTPPRKMLLGVVLSTTCQTGRVALWRPGEKMIHNGRLAGREVLVIDEKQIPAWVAQRLHEELISQQSRLTEPKQTKAAALLASTPKVRSAKIVPVENTFGHSREARIHWAVAMIEANPYARAKEVARIVGFGDVSLRPRYGTIDTFRYHFEKLTGKTPAQYARMCQLEQG